MYCRVISQAFIQFKYIAVISLKLSFDCSSKTILVRVVKLLIPALYRSLCCIHTYLHIHARTHARAHTRTHTRTHTHTHSIYMQCIIYVNMLKLRLCFVAVMALYSQITMERRQRLRHNGRRNDHTQLRLRCCRQLPKYHVYFLRIIFC